MHCVPNSEKAGPSTRFRSAPYVAVRLLLAGLERHKSFRPRQQTLEPGNCPTILRSACQTVIQSPRAASLTRTNCFEHHPWPPYGLISIPFFFRSALASAAWPRAASASALTTAGDEIVGADLLRP